MYVPDLGPAIGFFGGRMNEHAALFTRRHLDAAAFQMGKFDYLITIWAEDFHSQFWLTEH
jgi:hypothetical protein